MDALTMLIFEKKKSIRDMELLKVLYAKGCDDITNTCNFCWAVWTGKVSSE